MTESPAEDVMQQRWCCLTCSSTFRFGQLRMRDGALRCPTCEAAGDLHRADGSTFETDSYEGEVGTLN